MAIGITSFNQIRDINGYVSNTFNGNPISNHNQCFTLTGASVTSGTAPELNCPVMTAVITVTNNQDVFFLPASSPTLTAPSGSVTSVAYQMINGRLVTQLVPGQAFQFLCANAANVHIAYYANTTNNQLI